MRLLQLDPALADPDRLARHLRFSPDGRSLAAVLGPADGRRVVVRYDLHKDAGTVIPEPSDEDDAGDEAPDPAVSPDLELVAEVLADYDGFDRVRLTDTWAKPPEVVELPSVGEGMAVTAVGFAAGGDHLLVGVAGSAADDFRVLRWDINRLLDGDDPADGLLDPLDLPDGDEATVFADAGRWLAVGRADGRVTVFDLSHTRRPLTVEPARGRQGVRQLAFTPDGRRLVGRGAGAVAVWDVATGQELTRLRGPHPLTGFALAPDGHLLTSSTDGTVCRFAADFTLADRHAWGLGPLHSVAVAPDGLTAAAGGGGGRVVVWDV